MIFLYWYRTCNKTCRHEFKTRKIGILATGTLISELFNKTAQQFQNTKIIDRRPWISTAYRKRKMYSAEMTELHSYLIPMIDADIDYLVLGCSHYPI
jgi:glutamate racemase